MGRVKTGGDRRNQSGKKRRKIKLDAQALRIDSLTWKSGDTPKLPAFYVQAGILKMVCPVCYTDYMNRVDAVMTGNRATKMGGYGRKEKKYCGDGSDRQQDRDHAA